MRRVGAATLMTKLPLRSRITPSINRNLPLNLSFHPLLYDERVLRTRRYSRSHSVVLPRERRARSARLY